MEAAALPYSPTLVLVSDYIFPVKNRNRHKKSTRLRVITVLTGNGHRSEMVGG